MMQRTKHKLWMLRKLLQHHLLNMLINLVYMKMESSLLEKENITRFSHTLKIFISIGFKTLANWRSTAKTLTITTQIIEIHTNLNFQKKQKNSQWEKDRKFWVRTEVQTLLKFYFSMTIRMIGLKQRRKREMKSKTKNVHLNLIHILRNTNQMLKLKRLLTETNA